MVVKELAPGGAAERCGEIQPDDVVLMVLPPAQSHPTMIFALAPGRCTSPTAPTWSCPCRRSMSASPPFRCQRPERPLATIAGPGHSGSIYRRRCSRVMRSRAGGGGGGEQMNGVAMQTTEEASRAVLGEAGTEVSHRRGQMIKI